MGVATYELDLDAVAALAERAVRATEGYHPVRRRRPPGAPLVFQARADRDQVVGRLAEALLEALDAVVRQRPADARYRLFV